MIPVAVSVPASAEISITMKAKTWAFGEVDGKPVGLGASDTPNEGL